jgi:hypothetical protein
MSNTIKIGEHFLDLDEPVYGAATIGAVINQTERQAFHMLESGHLDATQLGRKWVSTPRRLLRRIVGDEGIAALTAAARGNRGQSEAA